MNDRDCENCKHHTEKGCDSWDCEFEQGMTNEEKFIEVFGKELKRKYATKSWWEQEYVPPTFEEYENADDIHREKEQAYMQGYEDASKKYRQEPCEDAISRQAVQDYIAKYLSQYLYEDVRQAVETIDTYIGDMPSVNPQEQKTGHWKHDKCDVCGASRPPLLDNYCPNCGAKMVEPQAESEDKE